MNRPADNQAVVGSGTNAPTPRTDAACHGFVQANPQKTNVDMWGVQCVDADCARGLEREADALRAELMNLANAKRFDRDTFQDDTEFADWAQSRARFALGQS